MPAHLRSVVCLAVLTLAGVFLPSARNRRARKRWLQLAFPFVLVSIAGRAQGVQFLPEVDTYLKVNSVVRTYFEAKDDRDEGAPSQVTIGPSVQFYVKPLVKLKKITTFDLDDSKPRAVVLEAGYRYVGAPNEPTDNRFTTAVTFHLPATAAFLITDRNRADLDWKGGKFTWRYRNKLTVERTFAVSFPSSDSLCRRRALLHEPVRQVEHYGSVCRLPAAGWNTLVEFNPYYEHENNTGKHPNSQTNSIGLAVYFYFSVAKK